MTTTVLENLTEETCTILTRKPMPTLNRISDAKYTKNNICFSVNKCNFSTKGNSGIHFEFDLFAFLKVSLLSCFSRRHCHNPWRCCQNIQESCTSVKRFGVSKESLTTCTSQSRSSLVWVTQTSCHSSFSSFSGCQEHWVWLLDSL